MSRDHAAEQLFEFKNSRQKRSVAENYLTTKFGVPVDCKTCTMTAGPKGPIVLKDTVFLDEISHFDRERIPERVVHAKGAGAFGYFEVTHDITKYCKASLFSKIGKRTDIAVRFSTVGGESGSADTVRDPRGFAVKFYTDEGIWDLVGNNTPIFFIRDPILFPSFIHTQKRNPVTHLKDMDMFWDFITLRPETTHQVMFLFSDRGIPDGYRRMNGYGSHTFKLVNARGEPVYCKFHYKTDQGIKCLPVEKAAELAGSDPDYGIRDLYNSIKAGKFPSWTLYVQVMTFEQADKYKWNPFDLTKVWPHSDHPLIPVGKLTLNRNPDNYFAQVEQIAFGPDHMVPGIEASPDKVLQARLFSYGDTHRHRLGANFLQLPPNCPMSVVQNYQRDGPQCYHSQGGAPNYFPNSFGGPEQHESAKSHPFATTGDVDRYDTGDEDNYSQATLFYQRTLDEEARNRLVANIVASLKMAAPFIQERAVKNFGQVDASLGEKLKTGLRLAHNDKANL